MEKVSEERLNELIEKELRLKKLNERSVYYSKRRNARLSILANKAIEAGISVTDKEIEDYINK